MSPFTVYPTSPNWSMPLQIRAGSDGNLWYGDFTYIGRVSPTTGEITEFPLPDGEHPERITEGLDGNIWFANYSVGASSIGKITPDGTITEYPLPDSGDNPSLQVPTAIAAGPDGNVWFIDDNNDIGLVSPTGIVLTLPMPAPTSPYKITAGADGNLWFTNSGIDAIGKITPSGVVTEYPLPPDPSTALTIIPDDNGADAIVAGPDGNIWFTAIGYIGKMDPSGNLTKYPINPSLIGMPDITVGIDGNLYFVESENDKIGKITPAGVVTEYALPEIPTGHQAFFGAGDHPMSLAPGADGRIWVVNTGENAGLMAVAIDKPLGPAPIPTIANNAMVATGPVSAFHDPDPDASPASFTAAINWGDGTITTGTVVTAYSGTFLVTGSHTYATPGIYGIYVVVTDVDTTDNLGGGTIITANVYNASTDGGSGVGGAGSLVPGSKLPGHKKAHHPARKPVHHPTPKHNPKAPKQPVAHKPAGHANNANRPHPSHHHVSP
jgi:streptogramin lyase